MSVTRAGPALLLLAACIDYNPAGKPGDSAPVVEPDTATEGGDSGDTGDSADTADSSAAHEEVCDGVDNDGDGVIDEEFSDSDADSVADCVDDTCTVALDREEDLSESNACAHDAPAPSEPWNVELMWTAPAEVECDHPVVADLDDDDAAEVLCPSRYDEAVWVVDGATGVLEARWDAFGADTHLALADLDRDGDLEIAGVDRDNYAIAVDSRGREIWRSEMPMASGSRSLHLLVIDLDGDGGGDVVSQRGAVRGVDGRALARFDESTQIPTQEFQIVGEDLDSDGVIELVYDWRAWDVASGLMWDLLEAYPDRAFPVPMAIQADGDQEAEIVWTTMDYFVLAEADATILSERSFVGDDLTTAAVPCAGDIDGDGEMEVVAPGANTFHAWDADGTDEWIVPMLDLTPNWGGCTTFDFDLDGAKEVVAVDQDALYILDGSTGATLYYGTDGFDSSTAGDTPIVVDLDGDGSVEILVPSPSNLYGTQLHAWRNVNRDWPPGMTMWPSTAWSGTSLLPDGRVPRTPHKPWLTTKVWRGQPELPVFGSDLRPAVGDVCVASCEDDGEVRVEVRLQNLGPDEVEAGVPLAVYGLDEAGGRVLLTVLTLGDWLDDGRAAASWEVVTTTAQAERGLVFVAGDDGTGTTHPDDCSTENSTVTWALTTCP